MSDLDQNTSIRALRGQLEKMGSNDPRRPTLFRTYADQLLRKYARTLAADDLDEAIRVHKEILGTEPSTYPEKPVLSYNYALLLRDKHSISGEILDLDNAIQGVRDAIALAGANNPNKQLLHGILADQTMKRFRSSREAVDLDDALLALEELLEILPPNSPERAVPLHSHASLLTNRYQMTGQISQLNEAIHELRDAVALTSPNNPMKAIFLNKLGANLSEKHIAEGDTAVLEESIETLREAVETAKSDHPNRATFLNNLGLSIRYRYKRAGVMDNLQEGIQLIRDAAESTQATDPNHPDLALFWNNLGLLYQDRYVRTGAAKDLEESVRMLTDAVKASPWNHPDRAYRSNNLGNSLEHLYERTGVMARLQDAIWATNDALRVTPPNDPIRPLYLNNLAIKHWSRYDRTRILSDILYAIRLLEEAVETTRSNQPDDPDFGMFLNNLGGAYKERYKTDKSPDYLLKAIQTLENAVAVTPTGHPDRAARLYNLGLLLLDSCQDDNDLSGPLSCFHEALDLPAASPMSRIDAGKLILSCCLLTSDWERAYEALNKAVRLVPAIAPKSLLNADKQHMLGQVVGLASNAAAVALQAGKNPFVSLEILELGRGILATSLDDMRIDVLDLKEKEPELAKQFVSLRDELDFPAWRAESGDEDRKRSWQTETNRRYDANRNFEQLVEKIRNRTGFEDFLLPPTQEKLKAAATRGPIVVINVSKDLDRCDTFLIQEHQIQTLPLPNLRYGDIEEKSKDLALDSFGVLEWLWDTVARPILDALGFTKPPSNGDWPHVWWIPIGQLSRFPLHAAGRHRKGSGETVLDRVISSYASSVKAIISGRRNRPEAQPAESRPQALLVGMENTPGQSRLPFASKEIELLQDLFRGMSVTATEPRPYKQDILFHLPACTFFHFAGHGYSDETNPSQSYLALEDWRSDKLTVADLLELKIRNISPFLAYLSACGTGQIKDHRLFDENVHIISACQLAGFRHVIGTLWEVKDESCLEMSRTTYQVIRDGGLTDSSVCLGLHQAARRLRDRWAISLTLSRAAKKSTKIGNSREMAQKMPGLDIDDGDHAEKEVSRDVIVCDDENEDNEEDVGETLYWVPYVHFGV